MKSIEELEKEIKKQRKKLMRLDVDEISRLNDKMVTLDILKKILGLIDKDIKFQRTKLTNDFEKDKPIKWRIVGMEELKLRIRGK